MSPLTRFMPQHLGWRFGLVVVALATFSLALGTQNAVDNNRNTRCLAAYSARNAEVGKARAAATQEKDDAVSGVLDPLVSVILDVTNPKREPSTPAEIKQLRDAAQRYKRATAELKAKRAANPLPEFPQQCSDVNR